MKTTIELSDNLLLRAKKRAKDESITLRSLIEKSLAVTLANPPKEPKIEPVTFKGKGLTPEFENASWDKIRDAIYTT
ncbi:MAG: hypothetical protein OSA93_12725 [Akkermansiaceae bacterium]|nr:hypothetical protein [Akkermansiaceae bacterium]